MWRWVEFLIPAGLMTKARAWKMYREAFWWYLRFIQETRRQKDVCNENENEENNATRDASDDIEMMNDNVFHDLTQTSDIPPPSHSISNTDIIAKKFKISSEHNYIIKSIEEILESVPKSYRKHTHLLMKYLLRKAVPDRISWNRDYTRRW